MTPEEQAIPYSAADLRGFRLLVLAPHPDDEVIGCGGLVAQHLRERRAVRVVVATDGGQAGGREVRERESRAALDLLDPHAKPAEPDAAIDDELDNALAAIERDATTEAPEREGERVTFLRFPDRELEAHTAALQEQLRAILEDYRPDLIAVTSPIEIHPDHLALARAFVELVQRDEHLFADLATTWVAFYEVGQPLRPNALVDISDVAEAKLAAIRAHASQLAWRDYSAYAHGLNAYRAMTLPADVKAAEAYWVTPLPALRTMAFSELRAAVGNPPSVEVTRATVPITVVVRTKDRPALLREAIDSIRATQYPSEIVVVNDGGEPVAVDGVTLVSHGEARGRSEAANAGVRAATSAYVTFLDDDDLHYREHLDTLATAASTRPTAVAWYSEAVSAFVRISERGDREIYQRLRLLGGDFDRDRLLTDNFIPLPTLLVRRDDFLALDGFDPAFDLFEDWDFLIRLAQRGAFVHVPRITCEIRHIEGGGSVTLAAPEGSPMFRDAKLAVWRKHAALMTHDVFASALEKQKRRLLTMQAETVDARGVRGRLEGDIARLEHDKQSVVAQLSGQQERVNAAVVRIRELEGANAELRVANDRAQIVLREQAARIESVSRELGDARHAYDEAKRTIDALYAEIARLQGLLDTIYTSRTWKLHSMVQRLKGQG